MLIFWLGYGLARLLKLRYIDAAPAAMIGASNHFEVAIATSTMLFGFGDTWPERVEHMLILRDAQDASGGFSCFIPLAFQPGADNFIARGPTPGTL